MRCGRRSIKSKNRDKKREGDADTDTERERESCGNVFGVRCGYNGVRRMPLNALRSQIDSKNTDERERERERRDKNRDKEIKFWQRVWSSCGDNGVLKSAIECAVVCGRRSTARTYTEFWQRFFLGKA